MRSIKKTIASTLLLALMSVSGAVFAQSADWAYVCVKLYLCLQVSA